MSAPDRVSADTGASGATQIIRLGVRFGPGEGTGELDRLIREQERDALHGHRVFSVPFDDERARPDVAPPNVTRVRRDLASKSVAALIRADRAISAAIIASVT